MKTLMSCLLLAAGLAAQEERAPAAAPVGGVKLIAARPFTLETPYTHDWSAERPLVRGGYVLVLHVDPAFVAPRQTAEPVLYAGARTLERVNTAQPTGHLVAILPAPVDAEGRVALDLAASPLFFGAPALPESVTAAQAAAELAAARQARIAPPQAAEVAAAKLPQVRFADSAELMLYAADLVEQVSPEERDLVAGLRAPRVGR